MNWRNDDIAVASIQRKYGIKMTEPILISLDSIPFNEQKKIQARLKVRYDPELAISYADDAKKGDAFPALVVWANSDHSKFKLYGGLHRQGAAIALGETTVMAHILESEDAYVCDTVPAFLNTLHGWRTDTEECYFFAERDVLVHGHKNNEAARDWNVNVKTLGSRVNARRAASKLADIGIKVTHKRFSDSLLTHMYKLSTNTPVFKAIATLLSDIKLPYTEALQLIDKVSAGTTEEKRLDTIKNQRRILVSRAGKAQKPINVRFRATIARMTDFANKSFLELGVTDRADVETIIPTLEEIIVGLRKQIKWGREFISDHNGTFADNGEAETGSPERVSASGNA